jgi:hypothetical protein
LSPTSDDLLVSFHNFPLWQHVLRPFRLFPADAGYRTDIDGLLLDIVFRCAVRIKTFCLAVVAEAEYIGEVIDAYSATDTHILIYKWFSCHINYPLFLSVISFLTG